jgi:hypothetical protein
LGGNSKGPGFSMKLGLGFGDFSVSELSDHRSLTVLSRSEEEEEEHHDDDDDDDGGFPGCASFLRVL